VDQGIFDARLFGGQSSSHSEGVGNLFPLFENVTAGDRKSNRGLMSNVIEDKQRLRSFLARDIFHT
jgi:hypothetical protein